GSFVFDPKHSKRNRLVAYRTGGGGQKTDGGLTAPPPAGLCDQRPSLFLKKRPQVVIEPPTPPKRSFIFFLLLKKLKYLDYGKIGIQSASSNLDQPRSGKNILQYRYGEFFIAQDFSRSE